MQDSAGTSGKTDSFAIVAVGASAGGFEAFTQLLRALPSNTGMAFVFIQHLDPKHHSLLSELLAKNSGMPVVEAKNGTTVQPNHVYVIPPNVNMAILARRLQLTPRPVKGGLLHTPIDFFMDSLAEARNSRSIGVVLSGTASDGTRGLAAIKAEGGITFAQEERSAKYNGMPHSAIASGCVDFVLPPEKIGQELARISGHPYLRRGQTHGESANVIEPTPGKESFERVFALLRNTCGINFAEYKPGTVQRRTLRQMAIRKIEHVSDYAKYLEKHRSEVEALCQDLLIPVTSFFRDLEAFEALKTKAFPAIVKDKSNKGNIRIWAPGCSTGEETYSLAIVLLEFLGDTRSSFEVQVFGTDVNERGIEKGRAGIYQERIAQELSPERLRRYFTKVHEGYRVNKAVRDLCVFAKQNLAEDPPFSQLNLVACRNLLIYLGPALQRKIVPMLHYALRPSGFLLLGKSESAAAFPELFAPADKKHKIFLRKSGTTGIHYDFSANRYPRETRIPATTAASETAVDSNPQQEADRVILKNYAPPGVVINDNMEILQFRGRIGPYLEPLSGRASLHLLKIARRDFAAELGAAVNQARKTRATVRRRPVDFRRDGRSHSVTISVEPLGASEGRQYLVLFERTSPSISPQRRMTGKLRGIGRNAKGELAQMRRKLAATEEHLRSVIESKEASDEEYQSANEEILSANEELQSTNEELETAQEELQSANEELNTVNDELHNRNVEFERANSDLNNLMASTTLPIVLVDRDLRIRRMTAASAKVFKILSSDVGRSIIDIREDMNVQNLAELIADVIETLTLKELEVQDKNGYWHLLQIRPYRTMEDKIDGAVLMLSDIDAMKRLNDGLQKSKEFIEDIVDTIREPLVVLTEDLKVRYVNGSFLKAFSVNRWEAEGKMLYDLGNHQWDIPKLRTALQEVVSKDAPFSDFEVEHELPQVGMKTMLLNARRITDIHSDRPMILLAIEDITERKREIKDLRVLSNALPQLVWMADPAGGRFWFNQRWYEYTGTTLEQMLGWGWRSVHDPETLPDVMERWRESIATGTPFEMVCPLRGADGAFRPFLTRALPTFDSNGKVDRWLGTNTDISEQRKAEVALQQANSNLETHVKERTAELERRNSEVLVQSAQLQELSVQLMQAQDDERRRISRELHDGVGQYLAHAKMSVESLRRADAPEKERESFSGLVDTLDKCLTETRTLSHLLYPPFLDEVGFSSAAKWYVEGFSERSGIQVDVNIPHELERLPGALQLALFRILQESLTNIHRYSHSQSAEIQVELGSGEIRLQVKDYGQGIPPEILERFKSSGSGGGVGLRSMRERIIELGGRFDLQSDKNGTLIRATAPLSAPTDRQRAGFRHTQINEAFEFVRALKQSL